MFDAERWNEIDDSSMIKALGARDGFLIVQFHRGEAYRYPNADHHMDELLAAESVGKYFHEHVRELPSQRLSGDEWPEVD
jgi:hypothetical protein